MRVPALDWARAYNRGALAADLTAAVIVTVMLVPQSLAYAMLAGLPAEVGLYASIMPLILYAFLGTSKTLSVGPVAVVSLMTAVALGNVAQQGTADYLTAAIVLALLSGALLTAMGLLKLGFLANFLSLPVVSGFISASGILIAVSQLKHVLGVSAYGETVTTMAASLFASVPQTSFPTLVLGCLSIMVLLWARSGAVQFVTGFGVSRHNATMISRGAPIVVIAATIVAAFQLQLSSHGVALVGEIPRGLPSFSLPIASWALIENLALPAVMISIIGYVESISVGRTLAGKKQQKIDADQELIGLGAANIASSLSGGFPVTGGFSRSVVNFDAGAETQAASIFAAIGIALTAAFLTPVLYYLPKVTLAATIIVAVLSLVDFSIFKRAWQVNRSDFFAVLITVLVTLFFGVELGVACGVIASIGLHLYRTSQPHIAEVGLVEGTEHFRNILRHSVQCKPNLLSLRMDQSLLFTNASYLEDLVYEKIAGRGELSDLVLMLSAVNEIDLSAIDALTSMNRQLRESGIKLHLSEVKGPVMDTLERTKVLEHLSGRVFLSQFDAYQQLGSGSEVATEAAATETKQPSLTNS